MPLRLYIRQSGIIYEGFSLFPMALTLAKALLCRPLRRPAGLVSQSKSATLFKVISILCVGRKSPSEA